MVPLFKFEVTRTRGDGSVHTLTIEAVDMYDLCDQLMDQTEDHEFDPTGEIIDIKMVKED